MAIKNKVKPDQYTEDASKSITQDKIKSESFAAVKMLIKKGYDVKTSFFVKAGHFKGDKVKYKGVFLAIGDSPALLKKFKQEKTDPTVAYGNLFVKKVKDEDVVHFEYVSGQGKLKKPADWKALFKEFKKMIKKKCAFVVDGQTIEDDTPDEDAGDVLERKAKIAENLLLEVEEIKSVYNREKKDKLLRKTTKWLTNYNELADDKKTAAIKTQFPKIQKAHATVKDILETDNKITAGLDQVFTALDKLMEIPDIQSPSAKNFSKKVAAALSQVQPLIKKVNDKELLKVCQQIQEKLTQ